MTPTEKDKDTQTTRLADPDKNLGEIEMRRHDAPQEVIAAERRMGTQTDEEALKEALRMYKVSPEDAMDAEVFDDRVKLVTKDGRRLWYNRRTIPGPLPQEFDDGHRDLVGLGHVAEPTRKRGAPPIDPIAHQEKLVEDNRVETVADRLAGGEFKGRAKK